MSNIGSERSSDVEQSTWEAFTRSRYDAVGALSSKDARVQAMERELAALETSRILARRLRNAGVSAACGLPSEVLTIIFLHLQAVWKPGRVGSLEDGWILARGWMTALRVCSIWRETAINTPVLWTQIPCSALSPHCIPIFLSRSRGLPLSLEFASYTKEPSKSSLRFWFSPTILRRAKAIEYAEAHNVEPSSSWKEFFKHAMPHLESLDISLNRRRDSNTITPDMFPSPTGRPHALKRLCLGDCYLSLGSPLLATSITYLSLSSPIPSSAPATLKLSDLLALPHLRELQLANIFPDVREMPGSIALPSCFELLQTRAHNTPAVSTACLDFVVRLQLPPAATVCLDLFTSPENTNIEELAGVLKTFFEYNTRSIVELRIEDIMLGVLYGERPREEWTQYLSEAAEPYTMDRVHGARHVFSTAPSVASMIPCINLTQLKSIYLFDSALKAEVSDNLLGALESAINLHRITLQSPWCCQALLYALGHCSEPQDAKPAPPRLLFPRLEVIIIQDHGEESFIDEEDPSDSKDRPAEISYLTASLLDLLERRSGHGIPVRELLVEETLKDWDVWKMVEPPTVVKFFQYTPASVWKPDV